MPQDHVSHQNLPGQISEDFTSGLGSTSSTSDTFRDLYHALNEYLTEPRPFHLNIDTFSMDLDTNINIGCDPDLTPVTEVVVLENKTHDTESSTSSDSVAQVIPLTLSHSQSGRRKKRPQDSQNLICSEPPCNNRTFSDQTCLTRHLREKHGSDKYYCPISTCNRHRRGFPRRFNLLAHKRRCHPDQASPLSDLLRDSPRPGADSSRGENRLWAKLNELKELRREIDEEIGTLEEAARIMSDYEQ